jgi:O-antigen/teichoic acid export membrane protein
LAPVIDATLHLDDLVAAAMIGFTVVPLTLTGSYAGILQGERKWRDVAAVYLCTGIGRIVAGGAALLVSPTLRAAMIGIAIGSLVPAAVGAWLTRTPGAHSEGHQPVVRELWRNGHTLLAFFAFTNVDVLLARHLFPEHDAGIYAAGVILAKTCLFLPTFVLVAAFPSMAADRHSRVWVKALLAVAALGLAAVAATWLLPDLAVSFAGGAEYADLGDIAWLFALEGTVFAMLQILVYESIAAQTHAAIVLWIGVVVVAGVALPAVNSVTALVSLVCLTAAGVALVTGLMPGAAEPD